MNPCDDLHQGALSSAILTHYRVDAPLLNFEGDVLQRLDAGKALRNSVDLQDRRHGEQGFRSGGVLERVPCLQHSNIPATPVFTSLF
jgi:hypothetical protein